MSYRIEKLANEPIILYQLGADYSLVSECEQAIDDLSGALAAQRDPVYFVADLSALTFHPDVVMKGTILAQERRRLLRHPVICEAIFVTHSPLLQQRLEQLNTARHQLQISIFASLEDALSYVRRDMMRGSAAD